jgi:hypothetical protein
VPIAWTDLRGKPICSPIRSAPTRERSWGTITPKLYSRSPLIARPNFDSCGKNVVSDQCVSRLTRQFLGTGRWRLALQAPPSIPSAAPLALKTQTPPAESVALRLIREEARAIAEHTTGRAVGQSCQLASAVSAPSGSSLIRYMVCRLSSVTLAICAIATDWPSMLRTASSRMSANARWTSYSQRRWRTSSAPIGALR